MSKSPENRERSSRKAVLKIPDLKPSKSAVLNLLASASSQRSYDHAKDAPGAAAIPGGARV